MKKYPRKGTKGVTRGKRRGRSPYSKVKKLFEYDNTEIIGMIHVQGDFVFLSPLDKRLDFLFRVADADDDDVLLSLLRAAKPHGDLANDEGFVPSELDGFWVVAELLNDFSYSGEPMVKVKEIIGSDDDSGISDELVVRMYGFDSRFSAATLAECEHLSLPESARQDLRDRYIFTVDPPDAKDFDDAISIDYVDGALRLGVHIADVSAYVLPGSAIDIDAQKRTTSVYLPGKVVPMLPELLSGDICSLRPDVDRLAFTADLYFDNQGELINCEFFTSLIRSSLRLDYENLQNMFDGTLDFPSEQVREKLLALKSLTDKLAAKRLKRGSLDFSTFELRVELDAEKQAVGIYKKTSTQATQIIEEAMIACNEAVAAFMGGTSEQGSQTESAQQENLMIYRIHDAPDVQLYSENAKLIKELGLKVETSAPIHTQIQSLIEQVKGKSLETPLNGLLLRCMKRALYSTKNTEHYGLASVSYTHFTSPIRRYPDLIVHRLLKERLAENEGLGIYTSEELVALCEHCSQMERQAELATYKATDIKVCEYMSDYVGFTFWGTIESIVHFGIFVLLDNGVTVMIHKRDYGKGFRFDEELLRIVDDATGKILTLGKRLTVKISNVDRNLSRISAKII